MAKLIKRDPDAHSLHEQDTQVGLEAPQRRAPIIDRESFEAKHEALSIRDRAEAQAGEILRAAEAKAEALLAEAEQKAEALLEEARQGGRQEGRAEGAQDYVALSVQLREQAEHNQNDLAPHIARLAMQIARKVLARELEFAPEMVVDIVKKTLGDKARTRRDITLRVHPSDVAYLRENKAQLLEVLTRAKDLRLQEDESVAPHGAIIETEAGSVDVQLATQLQAIEQALEGTP